jgi:hypothetical protein
MVAPVAASRMLTFAQASPIRQMFDREFRRAGRPIPSGVAFEK